MFARLSRIFAHRRPTPQNEQVAAPTWAVAITWFCGAVLLPDRQTPFVRAVTILLIILVTVTVYSVAKIAGVLPEILPLLPIG